MQVSLTSSIHRIRTETLDSVRRLVRGALSRFSSSISRVTVSLRDVNGPRGGVDKLCRVVVTMPRFGTISTSAKHDLVMVAVSLATQRARRMISSRLERRQTLRRGRFSAEQREAEDSVSIG